MEDKEIKVRLSEIRKYGAALGCEEAFVADYLARGTLKDQFLLTTMKQREAMRNKYAPRGIGDVVARFAKPIAEGIKTVTAGKLDLTNCGGCAQRQEDWNQAVPFKTTDKAP